MASIFDACSEQGVAQISCLEPLFERLVTLAASLAGIIFLIMLIVGGFKYLFASGDPKKTEAAKGTLTAAFLGVILIVTSYIVLVLIKYFTGIDVTIFKIFQEP